MSTPSIFELYFGTTAGHLTGMYLLSSCSPPFHKCDREFKSVLSLGRLVVLSGGTTNTHPKSVLFSDIIPTCSVGITIFLILFAYRCRSLPFGIATI